MPFVSRTSEKAKHHHHIDEKSCFWIHRRRHYNDTLNRRSGKDHTFLKAREVCQLRVASSTDRHEDKKSATKTRPYWYQYMPMFFVDEKISTHVSSQFLEICLQEAGNNNQSHHEALHCSFSFAFWRSCSVQHR